MAENQFKIELDPGKLTLADLSKVFNQPLTVSISEKTWSEIAACRKIVNQVIDSGVTAYGVNTGFGQLAQTGIDRKKLAELQKNLLQSHAAGVGTLLDDNIVRLVMLLKINSLARGYSGVRPEVVRLLVEMLNRGLYPSVPSKGSAGASGDLAPLAHLSLPLLGMGQVRLNGELQDSEAALNQFGLAPVVLEAKDGLALLNGTQVSTALALSGLFRAEVNTNAAFIGSTPV